ncbi:uncharacterized protein LOC144329911 isoform X2 [Macaca mulatta]
MILRPPQPCGTIQDLVKVLRSPHWTCGRNMMLTMTLILRMKPRSFCRSKVALLRNLLCVRVPCDSEFSFLTMCYPEESGVLQLLLSASQNQYQEEKQESQQNQGEP